MVIIAAFDRPRSDIPDVAQEALRNRKIPVFGGN
jgi:hypothetical protein